MFALTGLAIYLTAASAAGATTAPVDLRSASSFGALAGAGISINGPTTVTGDIGSFETTTMTGLGSLTLNGVNHSGDSVTQSAKGDLTTAYNDAAGRPLGVALGAGFDLGGLTLAPGVYKAPTSVFLTGDLTLAAAGDPNAVWIFQIGTTLISAANSHVLLSGGGQAGNVFWQVGTSATIGDNSDFLGNVMADQSVTLNTGAVLDGSALARIGEVVLNANTITVQAVPEPGTAALLLVGGLVALRVCKRRTRPGR
ncbi:MAG TPA: ice-binding family protein [Verrucomicrobiae bacterium]|nr:ice-binding family protein [Verrucomicrobiae bacterium]